MLPAKSSITFDEEIEQLQEQGFDTNQIELLMTYREGYSSGSYRDDPPEHRRLEFIRWLYEHGKLGE